MRIIVISDIHARIEMVRRLMPKTSGADAIIAAGDITHFGGYAEAAMILEPMLAAGIPLMTVGGNCDTDDAEEFLTDRKINIARECVWLDNFVFIGAGGSLPCPKPTVREFGDNVLETVLSRALWQAKESPEQGQEDALIVVSHQPAYGTRIDSVNGRFTGSRAIRKFIEIHQPILAVSGHIHEAFGTDTIGKTTLVNPGPLKDGRYAVVEINGKKPQIELYVLD